MKLYYSPGACSLSPHIALRESGLKFDLEQVDLKAKKTKSGADFNKVNPKGYVPTLQLDDGQILTEGTAIVQYIADKATGAKLAPAAGTMERYRTQETLNFIATELHKGFGPLFNPNMPKEAKDMAQQRLEMRLAYLNDHFASNQYMNGNAFSVTDAYAFTVLSWAGHVKIDLAKWPNVRTYYDRIAARPNVQEALKVEGLAK
ncbi:MAG: glutathione transferase GstA [Alphaproteobacteria bacterium]|nr:glutathione transferase GstA [Alphaproteobacteria bacterium]